MTTNTNTNTITNTETYKKGFYGHYIPNLVSVSDNFKTYHVANLEDAKYYAWHDMPEDMMQVRAEDFDNLKYETYEGYGEVKQHAVMKITDYSIELSIWSGSDDIYSCIWIVK